MPQTIYINGRFLAQNTTGVQRMGLNLLLALDALLAAHPPTQRWVVLCPADARLPELAFIELERSTFPLPPHIWQQTALPWKARSGLLLSLGGSAPYTTRNQICAIHDAAVFDRPDAYTFAFRCWYRLLFAHLARRSRVVLTVSRFSAERLRHHLPTLAGRLAVVPNGANHLGSVTPAPDGLSRWGLSKDRFLLVVGCQNRLKNLARLSEALCSVKAPEGTSLVVVGGGNARVFSSDALSASARGGMPVLHTGTIDDATLKALYQNALALVFPSQYEGFGLPPVEAMHCGCPVAVSRAGAIPEVCDGAALYFDGDDTASISQAVQQLVDDPALRDDLRRRGHARAAELSWSDAARVLMAQLARQKALAPFIDGLAAPARAR